MPTPVFAAPLLFLQAIAIPAGPMITISDVKVIEGDEGITQVTAMVEVYGGPGMFDVDIISSPVTADTADFALNTTRVTVGQGMPATVTASVFGDHRYEGDEVFLLTAALNGPFYPAKPGMVTIVDDDLDEAPHVSGTAVTAPEGSAGWHTIEVPVRMDRALDYAASVSYRTTGGTPATPTAPWGDYRPAGGEARFEVGQTMTVVPVEVNGDTAWEKDTTFVVELSAKRDVVVLTSVLPVILLNDDAPTVVTIEDARTDEGQTGRHPVSLRATFDPPAPPFASVIVNVVGGTARAGEDFVGQSLELHPSPGATSVTFATMIISDTTPECDEGIVVEYRGVETGDEAMKEAKVLIVDDDGPGGDAGTCPDPFATRSEPVEPAPDAAAPPPDAGAPPPDAGAPPDAAAERAPAPANGCTCGLAGREGSRGSYLMGLGLLALAGLLGRVRRRR